MALPPGFSPVEHLHDLIRKEHNKRVRLWFKNTKKDSIETPKENAYQACLIRDEDDANTMILRKLFFEFDVGQAAALQAPIYGIPVLEHQRNVSFKPQVKLYFRERIPPNETDRLNPATAEITFRLMNESSEDYTRAKAEAMAKDIKREFGTNPIFTWDKGIYYYYYRDYEKGYDLRLLCKSKAEGQRVTKAVLAIQGHPFKDDFEDFVENSRPYPMSPGTQRVYGQTVKKPVKRPRVEVRFRYAQLLLHGRVKVINLVATPESRLKQVIERLSVV